MAGSYYTPLMPACGSGAFLNQIVGNPPWEGSMDTSQTYTNYPSNAVVEEAGKYQLAWWIRFLPSPGRGVIDQKHYDAVEFHEALGREAKILNRICERFNELGGMTPELSKSIGWGPE